MVNSAKRMPKAKIGAPRERFGDRMFVAFSYVFITLFGIICLYPFLNIVAKSLSSDEAVYAGKVMGVWPIGFNLNAYQYILNSHRYVTTFMNTVKVTLVGTALNLGLTVCVAFAVSRDDMPGNKIIMFLYIFTMMFSGGMIPTYLVVSQAGLLDNHWALILPGLVSAYNVILMRNYIQGLPKELDDSAAIDGASQFQLMTRIILPLTLPSLATIGLFCAVGYWNTYFNALIYIDTRDKTMLQVYLREMLTSTQNANLDAGMDELANLASNEAVQGACVVATALPIIVVYPWLQKYYVKGMTIGAVKG
ncbi:MAG: carbohydrate ABC transporter permease [Christensenellales bacterium]|jgi:putative aldouronate transport system permease protein